MKKMLVVAIMVLLAASTAFCDITKDDIDKVIDKGALKHPYLYFNEDDKADILDRIKNDPESSDIMQKLTAEANRLLYTPVERELPVQGRNTRADWTENDRNNKYEDFFYSGRNNALTLAFVYQMTGDKRYADKAYEFAWAFCDLPSWTQRAHEFPVIYSRIMPWGVNDDQVNFNFDHINGDSGRIMAAVYDWLYPALDLGQRDRIRGALIEKVVTSVRGDWEYHWWAWAYRCNWCGVCNSGVGLTGLTLLTEDPHLTDIVAEAHNRINSMFNELGEDGGWQEGGGYWNYGVHTSTFFADALKRLTKGKHNLFKNERLKNNPVSFPIYISVDQGVALKFEDSGANRIGSQHLVNKLAMETKSAETAWYREEFFGAGNDIFDIIWPRPTIKSREPKEASRHFRTINWWVMRDGFKNSDALTVAGKAGLNDDPHHGHLDIGHFVIYWNNKAFIRDIGSGSYDEKYFDDMRFDYPQASSIGHNLISVNGEKQLSAKMRKQPWKEGIGGDVLEFRSSKTRDYVIMDPTNAYPKEELSKWRRHVAYDKPDVTVIVDEVTCDRGDEIRARFHPGVRVDVKDGYVLLTDSSGMMALIPANDASFDIEKGRHACQPVNATRKFFWIDYFDTVVKAPAATTVLATIITPVENEAEAKAIANSVKRSSSSGGLELSFAKDGKTLTYSFDKKADGLVLAK